MIIIAGGSGGRSKRTFEPVINLNKIQNKVLGGLAYLDNYHKPRIFRF